MEFQGLVARLTAMLSMVLLMPFPAPASDWTLTDDCELSRQTPEGSFAFSSSGDGLLLWLPEGLVAGDERIRVEFGSRVWRTRPVGGALELDGAVESFLKGNWVVMHWGDDETTGFSLSGSSAAWQRLESCDPPPREGWLALSGRIDESMDDRIIVAIRDRHPAGLVLDSPGGLAEEAQRIGDRVREAGLSTKVEAGMQCLSECVFILAAGKSRTVEPGARVGVTPSLITEGLGVFNADPGRATDSAVYFTQMGADGGKLAVLAISSSQGQARMLTQDELQSVGLVEPRLESLAKNPLAPRPSQMSDSDWWWLLVGLLGLGVVLRAASLRWTGG
jgi:hypothetical protein